MPHRNGALLGTILYKSIRTRTARAVLIEVHQMEEMNSNPLVLDDVAGNTDSNDGKPVVSHDDYIALATLRGKQTEAKNRAYDLGKVVRQLEEQLEGFRNEFAKAEADVEETTNTLQEKFGEVMEPLGVNGNVSIADTEPHYVTQL
jgi:hypothetical protein